MGNTASSKTFVLQNSGLDVPLTITPNAMLKLKSLGNAKKVHVDYSAEGQPTTQAFEHELEQRLRLELDVAQQKRLIHEKRSADQVAREAEDLIRRQSA